MDYCDGNRLFFDGFVSFAGYTSSSRVGTNRASEHPTYGHLWNPLNEAGNILSHPLTSEWVRLLCSGLCVKDADGDHFVGSYTHGIVGGLTDDGQNRQGKECGGAAAAQRSSSEARNAWRL